MAKSAICQNNNLHLSRLCLQTQGIACAEPLVQHTMAHLSDYFDSLEAAITIGHKCQSIHRATVFVHERTEYGLTVWKGNVEVFDLKAHPTAKVCYTWKYDEQGRSKIFAILGNKLITSAQKAVQAMICMDQQPIKLIPPFTNGLEILRQQVAETKKIIHRTEITSEELVASVETSKQIHWEIQQRNRRNPAVAL
jgi:hypothetical protein